MHHTVRVPKKLSLRPITVNSIEVQKGDRVRRQQILAHLRVSKKKIMPIVAPSDGWVKRVAVKAQAQVKRSDVLFVIDSMPTADYQVDSTEVNNSTELGENGRRKLERDGESELAKEFSAPLVNAPEANNGNSQHASANVTEHPTLKNVKEGVPLKTSAHAAANQHAVDRLNENVRNNPELQKQLGNELQQRLAMQATHSTAPTPRAT